MPPDRPSQPLALVLPFTSAGARKLLIIISTSSGSPTLKSYDEQNVPRQMLPCLTRSWFGETSPGGTGRQAETLLHGTAGTTDMGSPTLFNGRCGRV